MNLSVHHPILEFKPLKESMLIPYCNEISPIIEASWVSHTRNIQLRRIKTCLYSGSEKWFCTFIVDYYFFNLLIQLVFLLKLQKKKKEKLHYYIFRIFLLKKRLYHMLTNSNGNVSELQLQKISWIFLGFRKKKKRLHNGARGASSTK